MINQQPEFEKRLWQLGAWQTLALTDTDLSTNSLGQTLATCYRGLSQIQLGDCKHGVDLIKTVSQKLSTDDLKTSLLSGLTYSLGCARSQLGASDENTEKAQSWYQLSANLALGDLAVPSLVEKRTEPVKQLPVDFKLPDAQWATSYPEWSNHYVFNPVLGFWHRPAAQSIDYSDGDEIEERLLNALHRSADVSLFSTDLIQHQIDWPSRYHFSADRVNLLRPLATKLAMSKVLELGCGCGAITRYLGELGADVVALEGSLRRAEIAATRTRDLSNVTIVADRLQDIPLQGVFDVVTLIGVLEYSQVFVEAEDPIQAVLERAKSYLKPNGVLIVAIENQLGLKYFAGAPEDHGVGVMAGINDLYRQDTVITFGHQELKSKIHQAGFDHVETFLPFPDYKLPTLVIHPSGYTSSMPDWNLGTLLANTAYCDRQGIPSPTFSLERAWPVIARNGISADLANSHLFVATNDDLPLSSNNHLASYYSPSRAGDYSQQVDFVLEHDGQVSVLRRCLKDTAKTLTEINVTKEPYLLGELHADKLHAIVQRPNWSVGQLADWCQEWLQALKENLLNLDDPSCEIPWPEYKAWLPSNYIDAIPRNLLIQSDNTRQFFDLEWNEQHPIPLELVVYRGLLVTFCCLTSVAEPQDKQDSNVHYLIEKLMFNLGFSLSALDYQRFMPIIDNLGRKAQGLEPLANPPTTPYQAMTLKVRGSALTTSKTTGATLYWRTAELGFHEDRTIKTNWNLNGELTELTLIFPEADYSLTALRLDLTECPAHLIVKQLCIKSKEGDLLWQWDLDTKALSNIGQLKIVQLDGEEVIFISTGTDPQFILNLPEDVYAHLNGASVVVSVMGFFVKE